MGSEDSVETGEEGSSRRSSIGEDDRYSQRYQLLMRIQRDNVSSLRTVHSLIVFGTHSISFRRKNKRHTKYSLFHNPQRPTAKHGTWNPASSQEKHFNHPNVGSLLTAPRRIGSRVRLIDQSMNALRDDGIKEGG